MHPRESYNHKAIEFMKLENYSEALFTLKKGIESFGNHITSLVDMASCYYMLGDYQSFRRFTQMALQEFEQSYLSFSEKTLAESSLGLGKLLEELGHIYTAVKIYRLAGTQDLIKNKQASQRLLSQELRCLCTLNLKNEISQLYVACEQLIPGDDATCIENWHSLMLADCQFFNLDHAKIRLEKSLKISNSTYQRLLVFDFLYECLNRRNFEKFDLKFFANIHFQECDNFEKALWDIFLEISGEPLHQAITLERSEGMSPFSAAKFLHLIADLRPQQIDPSSALIKLQMYLRSFDLSSRTELQNLWISDSSVKTLSLSQHAITLDSGKIISAQRQQNLLQILQLFKQHQSMNTDSAIKNLFNDEFSESSFNRLRLAIARANKFLAVELGFNEPLRLTKSNLRLSDRYRIK